MTNNFTEMTPKLNLTMVTVPESLPQNHPASRAARMTRRFRFNFGAFLRNLASILLVILLSAGSYWAISRYFLETVQVVGVSMVPTLEEQGHYLLNRWAFQSRNPQRSDIVVIRDPADHGYSVKRIIATEGECIHFKGGKVFVDGKELAEPYLLPGTHTYTYSVDKEQLITCGKGQYFLLGDNRLRSIDSRAYGPVPRENILGLVVPHSRIGH